MFFGVLPLLWNAVSRVCGFGPEQEIAHSLVFMFTYNIIGTLTTLPFSLYSQFVIEEKHGFNKMT